LNFEDMKENAETGLRKAEVTDVDIRVRQETDRKCLSALKLWVHGRLWRRSRAQNELASGRSNDLDRSRSGTFYEMSSVFEIMGLAKQK
jgi:hypothetical protein